MGRTKWTEDVIIKFIEDNEYIFIKFIKFYKYKSRVLVKCSNPKHKPYEVDFGNFRNGFRCKQCCDDSLRFSYEDVEKYFNNYGYKLVSNEYIGANEPLNYICPNGHEGSIRYSNFQQGQRCPHCVVMWKGEREIAEVLDKNNIIYEFQKTFDGLVGCGDKRKRKLSYDFYIPSYNLLIEYQGEYHDGTARNQTKEQYERQKEHDKRKKIYAKNNKINILEIWYWDFKNIENILIKELNLNSL